MIKRNPGNPRQALVFFSYQAAEMTGEHSHAQTVMKKLAELQHFTIIDYRAQSLYDGFAFWIEFDYEPVLPSYILTHDWLPIGTI